MLFVVLNRNLEIYAGEMHGGVEVVYENQPPTGIPLQMVLVDMQATLERCTR